jgi:hypothetical protein
MPLHERAPAAALLQKRLADFGRLLRALGSYLVYGHVELLMSRLLDRAPRAITRSEPESEFQ